jgi:hypothetical protein
MKVLLRRDLFLEAHLYRASPRGTEIPDTLNGKKIILHSVWKGMAEKERVNVIPLPRDAQLMTVEVPLEPPQAPLALSQVKLPVDPAQALMDKAKK